MWFKDAYETISTNYLKIDKTIIILATLNNDECNTTNSNFMMLKLVRFD